VRTAAQSTLGSIAKRRQTILAVASWALERSMPKTLSSLRLHLIFLATIGLTTIASDSQAASGTSLRTANAATRSAAPSKPAKPAAPAAARQLTISIDWGDAMTSRESGLWIGYLFARMDFIGRNGGRYTRVPGVILPIFDEEVFARGEAAKIYRNLKEKNKAMESPYFNDLEKVDAAGYMPEYVWRYLKRNEWSTTPVNLRAADFERWSRSNLTANHAPETRGKVIFSTSGS
jgi:hypothetical protein